MMTKNSNTNKKSSTMARVALGATAVLALAGRVHAANFAAASGGGGSCATVKFSTASATLGQVQANSASSNVATGYLKNAPGVGATAAADFDDCVTEAGYYLSAKAVTNDDTGLVVFEAPANWYAPGGTVITATADLNRASTLLIRSDSVAGKIVMCPEHSTSSAGDDALEDCVVDTGYYLSTAGTATAAGTITKIPSGSLATLATSTANSVAKSVTAAQSTLALCSATYTGVSNAHMISDGNQDTAATDCKTAPGYEITTAKGSGAATVVRVSAVRAGTFNPGSVALATGEVHEGTDTCQTTFSGASTSSFTVQALASAKTQCVLAPGYSIKTASTSTDGSVQTEPTTANKYNPGGSTLAASSSLAVGDGDIACPFAGTSPVGSSAQSQCTPDCATTNTGSNAVASQGTCVCAANFYGSPIDADGNQAKPAKHGCLACPTGMVSGAGMRSCVYPAAAATAATPAAATPGAPGAPGASSGASSVSVFAAVAAIAAAQFAF